MSSVVSDGSGVDQVDQVAGGMPIVTMSQTEYGRHRGITQQAVSKAIADGRIPPSAIIDGKVDVAAADVALDGAALRLDEPELGTTAPAETAALTRARTDTELLQKRRLELILGKQEGTLLEVDDVKRAAEIVTDTLARGLELLATFTDDLYAAAINGGRDAVRDALELKVEELRRDLTRSMRGLAAGRTEGTQ